MAQETAAEIVKDGELLMAYVIRSGITIDQSLFDQIIEAKAKIALGPITAAEEAALYQAVNALAAKLAPVSAETIRAGSEEFGVLKKSLWTRQPYQYSHARLAVRTQRRWALFALALLLVAQIYWLIGSNLISRIPNLADSVPAPSVPSTSAPSTAEEKAKADQEQARVDTAEATRMWMLRLWAAPWRWLPESLKNRVSDEDKRQFNLRSDFLEWGYSAREVLAIFQVYLLPLLYGWVGSMAYVLRRMIKAVQDVTYRRVHDVEFSLRVYLGVLAGVAIGWFFKPDTTSAGGVEISFASLTPFALSFVAGYSVELLFTAMDRLVGAFTEKKSDQPPLPPSGAQS